MRPLEEVRNGFCTAYQEEGHVAEYICVGARILGFVFLSCSTIVTFTNCAFCVLEVTVVGTLWACMAQDGYTLWRWHCPGTSRVHSGKGNACYPFCSDAEYVGVVKSDSQFPGMVHEEDLHEDRVAAAPEER